VPQFEFTLERVLKARRQLEKLAEAKQLRARQAAAEARQFVNDCEAEQAAWSEQVATLQGKPLVIHEWQANCERSAFLQQKTDDARLSLKRAEEAATEAARERAAVAAEVEALVTLREGQLDEFKRTQIKLEQERVDEAGLRRHLSGESQDE
jgi:flagellar protein FliJ